MKAENILRIRSRHDTSVGTGYLIGPRLALTAYHVWQAAEDGKGHPCTTSNDSKAAVAEALIWSDRGNDLALVRVQIAKGAMAASPVFAALPSKVDLLKVRFGGYPSALRHQGRWDYMPFEGQLRRDPGGDIYVKTSEALLDDVKAWTGLSGAPLFVEDHLIGIIHAAHSLVEGTFVARAITAAHGIDPDFYTALGAGQPLSIQTLGERYGPFPIQPPYVSRLKTSTYEDLKQLSAFFDRCMHREGEGGTTDLFELARPPANGHRVWLKLRGAQGAGKTTFLSALHTFLEQEGTQVRYIDATSLSAESSTAPKTMINDRILELSKSMAEGRYVLMVDNLAGRDRASPELAEAISARFETNGPSMIVWAMTDDFESRFDQLRRPRDVEQITLVMDDVVVESDDFNENLELFLAIRSDEDLPRGADYGRFRDAVRKIIIGSASQHILYLLLCLRKTPNFPVLRSVSQVIGYYCWYRLGAWIGKDEDEGNALFAQATELAYRTMASDLYKHPPASLEVSEDKYDSHAWKLVNEHPDIRDFLAAYYIATRIKQIGEVKGQSRGRTTLSDMARQLVKALVDEQIIEFDFPQKVSNFVRDLLTEDNQQRNAAIAAIKVIDIWLRANIETAKKAPLTINFLAYIIGRLAIAPDNDPQILLEALAQLVDQIHETLPEEDKLFLRKQNLVARRTIAVSRAKIHPTDSDIFLEQLLADPELAAIDRGYHRLYYGDRQGYRDEIPSCYEDNGTEEWSRTFRHLRDRLQACIHGLAPEDDEDFRPVHLNNDMRHKVVTCLLFIQRRMDVVSDIEDERRAFSRRLVTLALQCHGWSDKLKHYLEMVEEDLLLQAEKVGSGHWQFLFDLYWLKMEPRRGWLVRNVASSFDTRRIESVADHSLLAAMLAHFLLPEKECVELQDSPPRRGNYDKAAIVRIAMMHDIAEAFTGDIIARHHSPEMKKRGEEREKKVHRMIRWRNTYGLHGTDIVSTIGAAFERQLSPEKLDRNSMIAKEVDRFENLMQLQVYHETGEEALGGALEIFETSICKEFRTPYFQRLSKEMLDWSKKYRGRIFEKRVGFDESLVTEQARVIQPYSDDLRA